MMKLLILIFCFIISSCDAIKNIKFKYYYNQKGEMLCVGKMEDNKEFSMHFTKLNTESPLLEMNRTVTKFSKILENEKMLNIQNINYENGSSNIILVDKSKGKMISVWIGLENENLVTHKLFSDCK